jgi:hypothetical protein
MVAQRRRNLTDDVISELIPAEDDGDRLTADELLSAASTRRLHRRAATWADLIASVRRVTNGRAKHRRPSDSHTSGRRFDTVRAHQSYCRSSALTARRRRLTGGAVHRGGVISAAGGSRP